METRVQVYPQDPSFPTTNRLSIFTPTFSKDRDNEVVSIPSGRIVHFGTSSLSQFTSESSHGLSRDSIANAKAAPVKEGSAIPTLTATTSAKVSLFNSSTIYSSVASN